MAKAVLMAVVLMQCCNVILAARPLLEAAAVAGGDGGWLGLIMQVLDKGNPSRPPSTGNPGGGQAPRRP
ncbi:hypothetical protein SETIT_9G530500v2 [Setaria italica]|uniref:Uncharacterized protein n=3 Tax=Setaria TaxID=4554 RepID=A0A368SVM0_SETIT|nr:hypothetical protein SETIT_9G530500v2 [Setaria italica]TKV98048.1 hypothetical protein SEVIR_9G534800v2 [Setaria viridis]